MNNHKSMIEIAVELMESKKGAQKFSKLIEDVATMKGLSKEEFMEYAGDFYSDIVSCGLFVCLGDGMWDLKKRQPFGIGEYEFAMSGEYAVLNDEKEKEKESNDEEDDDDEYDFSDIKSEDDYSDGDAKE